MSRGELEDFSRPLLGTALVASLLAVAVPAGPTRAAGETITTPAATRIAPNSSVVAISDDFNIVGYGDSTTLLANVAFTASSPANTTFTINTTTNLTRGYGYNTWAGIRDISFTGTQSEINAALDSLTVTTGAASGTAILSVSATTSDANVYYFS